MTAWMDDAKCGGVRDFTEWPRASRLILCEANGATDLTDMLLGDSNGTPKHLG